MAWRTGAAPGVREPTARPRPKTAAMPTAFISVVSDENHFPANCLEDAATLGFSTFSFSTSDFPSSKSFFSFKISFSTTSVLVSANAGIIWTASSAAAALSLHSSSFSAQSRLVAIHSTSCSSSDVSGLSFFSPNIVLTLLSSAEISASAAAAAIRAASAVSMVD